MQNKQNLHIKVQRPKNIVSQVSLNKRNCWIIRYMTYAITIESMNNFPQKGAKIVGVGLNYR